MAQGDHTNAASQLKVACALDPNRTEAWAALGKAQVSLGDLDDGIATLRHATGDGAAAITDVPCDK